MRRFLTLVFLLCLAIPAGVSISGCTRNPAAKYCPGFTYGRTVTDVDKIILEPQEAGISLAYGQTTQAQSPTAITCTQATASVGSNRYAYGTTNNQLVDISPTGNICAGTWNRNTGGGIADYTYCNYPNPLPTSSGLPYGIAYITASVDSVTSNPVAVYIHAPITSISLVGPPQCQSQGTVSQLDALAYYGSGGSQTLLCEPTASATVTAFSAASNVVTLTASNSFDAGERVTFSGLGVATFLNNKAFTVLGTGLSGTEFQVAASTANAGTTADTGVAATSSYPACESSIGTMNFTVGTSSVATINSDNNQITANQPGTTAITASIAGSGSSAGYFSTCPPASISVTLANGATSGTIAQGTPQNLTTIVRDTNGNLITGVTLGYQSTNPIDISVGSGGAIATSFPGTASVNAICQPSTCNPAPINELGLNGTGVPISSNPVTITVPGKASEFAWFASPGQSQFFVPIELLTGTVGSNVRLPYVPNSMVMDRGGDSLYFGSPRELMAYSTTTNTISKQDPNAPGVVLAVSPNNGQLLVNDQARQLFYLYNTTAGSFTTFGGMGAAAAWTPDSQTLYIIDNSHLNTPASCLSNPNVQPITGHTDTLYVYNVNTGWTVEPLAASPPLPPGAAPSCTATPNSAMPIIAPNAAMPLMAQTPSVTIPGVGAYLTGDPTVAHTWCPTGTVGNNASIQFYPEDPKAADVTAQADVLGATLDGAHVLGAAASGNNILLSDIGVTIPSTACPETSTGSGPTLAQKLSALSTNPTLNGTVTLNGGTGVAISSVNQVVVGIAPATAAANTAQGIAFFTYSSASTAGGAQLPYYLPAASGTGTSGDVTLTGGSAVTAPLVGAFSPDDTTLFVSTAGDDKIHYISIPASLNAATPPTDSQQISPNLPACLPVASGGLDAGCTNPNPAATIVPATAIAVKPRSTT